MKARGVRLPLTSDAPGYAEDKCQRLQIGHR